MNRSFTDDIALSPERQRSLQRRSDGAGLRRLLAQGGLYLASAAGLVLLDDPAAVIPLFAVSAVVQGQA